MLRLTHDCEAMVERFIGGLTIALGIGAMIPRPGFGLYSVLEQSGERAWWSLLMLNVGVWLIVVSALSHRRARMLMLLFAMALWVALIYKFCDASLWGAAIQGFVVTLFAAITAVRLARQGQQ